MKFSGHHGRWLFLTVVLLFVSAFESTAQQTAQDTGTSQGADAAQNANTSQETTAPQDTASPPDAAPKDAGAAQDTKAAQDTNDVKGAAVPSPSHNSSYSISETVSIDLSQDWRKFDPSEIPPPAGLAAYGPPFHLSALLSFSNTQEASILQLATSDNPLVGHDPYWLDTQLHTADSGMSMPDFLFYLFLPPSRSCMDKVSQTIVDATRVSAQDGSAPPDMQVFYECPWAATLTDFYAARVSPGITFRQGATDGPHASGVFGNFYFAPMEQVDLSGMTFFVFEAQQTAQLTPATTAYFNLPDALQGANADFFWAIGTSGPSPFVADPSRKDVRLIHVAYAASGVGPDKRAAFMALLHQLHTVGSPDAGASAVSPPPAAPPAAESGAPADAPADQNSNEGGK